jgi:hypothetical protein
MCRIAHVLIVDDYLNKNKAAILITPWKVCLSGTLSTEDSLQAMIM